MLMTESMMPKKRCEAWDTYGCPGGPSGDEFADSVDVRCTLPATHTVKFVGWVKEYLASMGEPTKEMACRMHAHLYEDANEAKAYRFRKEPRT